MCRIPAFWKLEAKFAMQIVKEKGNLFYKRIYSNPRVGILKLFLKSLHTSVHSTVSMVCTTSW